MDDLSIKALKALKGKVSGLPTVCRLLAYELTEYIDLKTGLIKLEKTLAQFICDEFYVEAAPGRKSEKSP